MQAAIVLFALAAAGGLTMAFIRWRGSPRPPDWLVMGHGLLAGAGLTLLIREAVVTGLPTLGDAALGLFALAALGGVFINLRYHAKQLPLPKAWVAAHAVLAVVAFALLLAAAFGR